MNVDVVFTGGEKSTFSNYASFVTKRFNSVASHQFGSSVELDFSGFV